MKKYLLAGLILLSMATYSASVSKGEAEAEVETTATVLPDLVIDFGNATADAGGSLYFGSMFRGDTKDTWTSDNGAYPATPTIKGAGSITTTTSKGSTITGIDMDGAYIEYELPQTVVINSTNESMTVTLYDGTGAADKGVDPGAAIPAAYKPEVQMTSDTAPDGKYELVIHGEVTASTTQELGLYKGTFDLIARYTDTNTWY